ncbi:MAG: hypothetical protein ACTSXQ_05185 [Alphaproteobacteria bacterium]
MKKTKEMTPIIRIAILSFFLFFSFRIGDPKHIGLMLFSLFTSFLYITEIMQVAIPLNKEVLTLLFQKKKPPLKKILFFPISLLFVIVPILKMFLVERDIFFVIGLCIIATSFRIIRFILRIKARPL